jgi:ubiquinone/menaquinone biosynthesis C-methylase UbiE
MSAHPEASDGALDSVARAYDRWCVTYDEDVNRTRDLDAQFLRTQNLGLAGRDVLELGCGTGKNTPWLSRTARALLALDFSAGMLQQAERRLAGCTNVRFLRHDLRDAWPIKDESYDRVVGNLVLEHIRDLEPILREAWRVLRCGGLCYLSELHPFRQLLGRQARFQAPGAAETELVDAYLHDVQDFIAAALGAGFVLGSLAEVRDPGAATAAVPRLLVTTWTKAAPA